jgi:hypothetical protein
MKKADYQGQKAERNAIVSREIIDVGKILQTTSTVLRNVRTGVFYDGNASAKDGFGVDFSHLDPSTLRQADADLPLEGANNVTIQELTMGRMATVLDDSGNSRGPFYVDTPESADHLINALTRAIQLCGSKKSAF